MRIFCRRALLLAWVVTLSACGNSGGDRAVSTQLSTDSLTFSAASPDAPTPAAQSFAAALGADAITVSILHAGSAIADVSYTLADRTVQVVVSPASPADLGAGSFTGAVTITPYACGNADCSRVVPGAPQVVHVTFGIPPIVRFVAPYVATSNASDTAVIRGRGFQQFPVSNVTFGGVAATTFSVSSDTEIHATYPALAAGVYPVQVDVPTSPGIVSSGAVLVAVDAPSYPATTVAYPSPISQVQTIRYDAQRQALLLALDGTTVVRYTFSAGAWAPSATAAVSTLSDMALSTDGTQLLALSQTALTPADPATLALQTPPAAPTLGPGIFFKNLSVANDGNAIVTTGFASSNNTPLYVYATRNPGFSQPPTTPSLDNATPGVSADGALVVLTQGNATNVYQYAALRGEFSATSVVLAQNGIAPVLDRSARRIVLNGTQVYDSAYTLLGTLPSSTAAVVLKPDATRAYTFDSTTATVRSFDLTADVGGGAFAEVGTGTTLAGNPGSGVKMAISPDGGTVFLAGSSQIVVQPTPP